MASTPLASPPSLVRAFRPVDPLGEALHGLRMRGTFYCLSRFSEPWGLDLPPMPGTLMFHILASGSCRLEVEGAEPMALRAGDVAMVPHGRGHRLRSAADAPVAALFDLPRQELGERYEVLHHGGGGAETAMVCGAVHFEEPLAQRLIDQLPPVMTIEAADPTNPWIHSTIALMVDEVRAMRPGGDAVITRVSDILVIQAIRSWLGRSDLPRTAWLAAMRDPLIGRSLTLLHHDPFQPWSVATIAQATGMSRSAFAARFLNLMGEPPMHYLRTWRMQVAVQLLKQDSGSVADLAEKLGYNSEAAFNRAFKKTIGLTPGAVRRGAAC